MKNILWFMIILLGLYPGRSYGKYGKIRIHDSLYEVRDIILLKRADRCDSLLVTFNEEGDSENSLIIYTRNNRRMYVYNFLTCDECKGRGATGSTYGGHKIEYGSVVLIQELFNCVDSIYLDCRAEIEVPSLEKIVRRSYSNEKTNGPDDAGNYIFIAKKKNSVSIEEIELPMDRASADVTSRFYIHPIKWKKLVK